MYTPVHTPHHRRRGPSCAAALTGAAATRAAAARAAAARAPRPTSRLACYTSSRVWSARPKRVINRNVSSSLLLELVQRLVKCVAVTRLIKRFSCATVAQINLMDPSKKQMHNLGSWKGLCVDGFSYSDTRICKRIGAMLSVMTPESGWTSSFAWCRV